MPMPDAMSQTRARRRVGLRNEPANLRSLRVLRQRRDSWCDAVARSGVVAGCDRLHETCGRAGHRTWQTQRQRARQAWFCHLYLVSASAGLALSHCSRRTKIIDGVPGVARIIKDDKGKLVHEPDVLDATKAAEKVLDVALIAPRREVADVDLVAAHLVDGRTEITVLVGTSTDACSLDACAIGGLEVIAGHHRSIGPGERRSGVSPSICCDDDVKARVF